MEGLVSIVIRTMPGREQFLDRCLFILGGQSYPHLEPVVVAQARSDSESTAEIEAVVRKWRDCFDSIRFVSHVAAFDARARSLNLGKNNSSGRYLCFLDDDDKVYPPCYEKLLSALQRTDFSWGYVDTVLGRYNEHGQLIEKSYPFHRQGYAFLDHLRGNFMPIHSFLIDRTRAVGLEDFEESMSRHEDYDFLLRLASRHKPLYVPYWGAEYCIRNDGSNTVTDGTTDPIELEKKRKLWKAAQDLLDERKISRFGWWVRELDSFPLIHGEAHGGVAPPANLHGHTDFYRKLLGDYWATFSWRVTRPLRNLIRRSRGQGRETPVIPDSEHAARMQLDAVLHSTSWKITAPLRWIRRLM